MIRLLPILLIFVSKSLFGQTYFEDLYGGEGGNGVWVGGTVNTVDGFLTLSYKLINGRSRPFLFRIDLSGNQQDSISFEQADSVYRLSLNLLSLNDISFVGLTSFRNLNQPSETRGDFFLFQFNHQGNVGWERTYGDSGIKEIPQRVKQTSDGGFIMVGQKVEGTSPNDNGEAYLVRTSSNGTQLWEMSFGGSQYDAGADVVETPDGGFMLLGWTRSFGAGQRDFYLVKTDAQGNELWHETYGNSQFDSGSSIIALGDGNYLLAGYRNLSEKRQGYLYKITPTGAVIWENDYGDETTTEEFNTVLELPNGDIVAAGLYDPYGAAPQSDNGGLLVRTDSEGNELWRRVYQKNENTDLFYSVLATEDGGFLLSGQAINEATNSQDAWLLKVDSIGCPYPNCTVGIEEVEKTVMVDVWPNPVSDVLNIEVIDPSASLSVTVFDMSGRIVSSPPRKEGLGEVIKLDVSTWLSGIYILKGMDENGRSFSMKIVRQ